MRSEGYDTVYVYCYPEKGIKSTLNFELLYSTWSVCLCVCVCVCVSVTQHHTFHAIICATNHTNLLNGG